VSQPSATNGSDGQRLALDASTQSSPKKIISWAMWDWGTQPFNTVITTFVFAVYIVQPAFGPSGMSEGDAGAWTSQALGISTSIAGILVALIAPVVGQSSDRTGHTMRNLRWLTWILAILSASLFFIQPSHSFLIPALLILGLGSVVSELASVNNNAMLEEVATGRNAGRVSGFGWGMGYLGGIIVLLVLFFGLLSGHDWVDDNGIYTRLSMLICGAWTLIFTIPTFLNLKDRPITRTIPTNPWTLKEPAIIWSWLGRIVGSYQELWRSLRRLWKISRNTVFFLLASALYRDGLAAVFAFGAAIASITFGFSATEVIIFGAAANVLAGLATMAFGLLDDKIGPKKVIMISLVLLLVLAVVIFFGHSAGKTVFWIAGLGLTLFVGPAQSAGRSFLARIVPEGHAGEVFGMYATTGRVVSFLSPALFTLFITIGSKVIGASEDGAQYWGILGIIVVLLAGLLVLIPVKEPQHHTVSFEK
jgi:UMF1 family MFS transporter